MEDESKDRILDGAIIAELEKLNELNERVIMLKDEKINSLKFINDRKDDMITRLENQINLLTEELRYYKQTNLN